MTLRKKRPLERIEGRARDARIFVIAVEDTYIQQDYFERFRSSRIQLRILPTPKDKNNSAPRWVLERLVADRTRFDWEEGDEFWISFDVDRWPAGSISEVLKEALKLGFHVAVTNPCFEFWLVLHLDEATKPLLQVSDPADYLKTKLGGYSKKRCPAGLVTAESVARAVSSAKLIGVPAVGAGWPKTPGTQLHELVEKLLQLGAQIVEPNE